MYNKAIMKCCLLINSEIFIDWYKTMFIQKYRKEENVGGSVASEWIAYRDIHLKKC